MRVLSSLIVASCLAVPAIGYAAGAYSPYGVPSYGSGYSTPRAPAPSYGTGSNYNSANVQGYTRSNGTYVAPSSRSMPDNSINNNWSTKGNSNPYTGQQGTQRGNAWGQ